MAFVLAVMDCEICKKKVGEIFLGKPKGAYVKDGKGKKRLICFDCQKKLKTKAEILTSLK